MNNAAVVDIFDRTKDGAYELGSIAALLNEICSTFKVMCYSRFGILPSCAYAVEELATCAEVEHKIQIMGSLCGDEHQVLVGEVTPTSK